jgi:hypothetical protein
LSYFDKTYAPRVNFYGKVIDHQPLIGEKRKYVERWPERVYVPRAASISIDCDQVSSTCTIKGIVDWDCRSPARDAKSIGAADFTMQVAISKSGIVQIVAETGSVISRQLTRLEPTPTTISPSLDKSKTELYFGAQAQISGTVHHDHFSNCCTYGKAIPTLYIRLALDSAINLREPTPARVVGNWNLSNVTDVALGGLRDLNEGDHVVVLCASLDEGFTGHYPLHVYCSNPQKVTK